THSGTVAARLDAPLHDEEPGPPVEIFNAGDHVRHPKFGEGIVVSCEPSGPADYLCVVAFRGEPGIKKLLLSFAPLERLQIRPGAIATHPLVYQWATSR